MIGWRRRIRGAGRGPPARPNGWGADGELNGRWRQGGNVAGFLRRLRLALRFGRRHAVECLALVRYRNRIREPEISVARRTSATRHRTSASCPVNIQQIRLK